MGSETTIRLWARAFTRDVALEGTAAGYAQLAKIVGDESLQPRQMAELTPAGFTPRVAVCSQSSDWVVQSMADSLDVMHTPPVPNTGLSIAEFCRRAGEQLESVLKETEARSSRIAVLWERLLPTSEAGELERVAGKLLNCPATFEKDLFEWDWRVAARVERTFAEHSERTNTLATVKRVEATYMGQRSDRLMLNTDVNTDPKAVSSRFGAADVRAFVEEAATWHDQLTSEVKTFLEVES